MCVLIREWYVCTRTSGINFILTCVQVQSHPLTPVEMENLLQNPATLRSEYKVRWKDNVFMHFHKGICYLVQGLVIHVQLHKLA